MSDRADVAEPTAAGGNEMILVVEDEDAIRELTRQILARNGYHVLTAATGAEALSVLSEHGEEIDLLLTDVVLPQILGQALVEELRTHRPDLRVLYMSGYAQSVLASPGTFDQDVELIEKPFSERALLAKVRQVLDGR